jgi:hypothetical protein
MISVTIGGMPQMNPKPTGNKEFGNVKSFSYICIQMKRNLSYSSLYLSLSRAGNGMHDDNWG